MGKSSNLDVEVVSVPENPLKISYKVIYEALKLVFPDQYRLILNLLNRVVVINKEIEGFSTMGMTREGTLLISQSFWDEHMIEESALCTVLKHEMMHCIGGDMYSLLTPEEDKEYNIKNQANNIAMDARINAYICNTHPEIYPEEFFSSFYTKEINDKEVLTKLLTPSSTFDSRNPDELKLSIFHNKFYNSEEFCSHHDLYELVLEILNKRPKSKTLKIKLIGNHGETGDELTDEDLEGVDHIELDTSELNEIKAEDAGSFRADEDGDIDTSAGQSDSSSDKLKEAILEQLGQSSSGAGKGTKSSANLIKLCNSVTEKFDLSKFKKMMFDNIFHNVRTQAKVRVGSFTSSPVMPKSISTSDILMAAGGYIPLMWKQHKSSYKMDSNLLPIYLDVSGSTYSYLPRIVKLITNVSKELEFVWGFSNRIEKHTTKELSDGVIKGTGGTDFNCVIDHAMENKYEHIVVISDGEATCRFENGWYDDTKPSHLPGIKSVVTVLFGCARKNNFFSRAYGNTHMIEEVIV